MPNCPNCGQRLAYMENGSLCPQCYNQYTPYQTTQMKGYNILDAMEDARIYAILDGFGLLRPGVTMIETVDGEIQVTHLDEPF